MSFPPRPPPLGLPVPPPFGYPPLGLPMPPMSVPGMGLIPRLLPRPAIPPQSLQLKLPPKLESIEFEVKEKPPVTTVFVGNISDRAPDLMIRTMLQRCGNVISWKRVQGASGKLQAFGFCEFEHPEATRRCVRLLNNWPIADKNLVVKVDAKTEGQLQEYFQKLPKLAEEEDAEEVLKRDDRPILAGFEAIMKEYAADLRKTPPKEHDSSMLKLPKPPEPKKDQGLDDMDVEEEKKSLISREIDRFREAHKDDDDEKEKEPRKSDRRGQPSRGSDRDRDRDVKRGEMTQSIQHRDRPSSHERDRIKEKQLLPLDKDRKRRSRSKEPIRAKSKERDTSPRPQIHDAEDEEEANERRRMERKMREKEAAYQERLKVWEARERKKLRDFEKERDRTEEQKIEEDKEGRRLREFLEDYDDERDDSKYYRGSALSRRLKEREKESEMDMRDRQKEKEEIEELKKKLTEEGHPDPEGEALKLTHDTTPTQVKAAPVLVPKLVEVKREDVPDPLPAPEPALLPSQFKSTMRPVEPSPADPVARESKSSADQLPVAVEPSVHSEDSNPASQWDYAKVTVGSIKLGASDSPSDVSAGKRKKITINEAFVADDDDTADNPKKRKLVPIDYAEDDKSNDAEKTLEEKRRAIKKLIERIPTEKEDLFSYALDWTQVNSVLLDNRIRPWVNKKIVEYIGEEEPTLTDFICQKVMGQSTPQSILQDVAMVLDEEAEVFVVKMWRLLIYETEAKRAGLVK